ncbi:MAG: bifunctional riboflavin kinase/FAD synthetase [Alphaproteobacteria bacterium]|nr:bifunctional riboflavin kinase/FAD synthetase [Alphaproteobacteria bacterium]
MKLFRHLDGLPADVLGSVIAWGNFDGFHRGHQAVVSRAARIARERGAPLAVMTTEPHPSQFFRPDSPSFRLMTLRSKAQALEAFGVEVLFVLAFDAALANTPAEDFVRGTLAGRLQARHVVTGYDQRFGKGRQGDAELLNRLGGDLGFGVTVVDPLVIDGEVCSSSRVRERLREGETGGAALLMDHWWRIEGRVEHGDARGRQIGFPTANLSWGDYLEPALGVYAVRMHVEDGPHRGAYDGVANLGRRPTFGKTDICFEVHLFDFDGDLYGAHVGVDVIGFIRPERKFDGLEALKAQIAADAAAARRLLASPEGAPGRFPPAGREPSTATGHT